MSERVRVFFTVLIDHDGTLDTVKLGEELVAVLKQHGIVTLVDSFVEEVIKT